MKKTDKDWEEYVIQTAELVGIELTPEYLPGVVKNFNSLAEIATLVMEFELPEDIEVAPVFEP